MFRARPVRSRTPAARQVLPHDGIVDYYRAFAKKRISFNLFSSKLERQLQRAYAMAIFEVLFWVSAVVAAAMWC
jgi:hypothetical protein